MRRYVWLDGGHLCKNDCRHPVDFSTLLQDRCVSITIGDLMLRSVPWMLEFLWGWLHESSLKPHICMHVVCQNSHAVPIHVSIHPMERRRQNIFMQEGVWPKPEIQRDSVSTQVYCWCLASHSHILYTCPHLICYMAHKMDDLVLHGLLRWTQWIVSCTSVW